VQRFRSGLVFKADRLRVSLNSRLESNKEEEDLAVELLHCRLGRLVRLREKHGLRIHLKSLRPRKEIVN